jgi:hypothetical protein
MFTDDVVKVDVVNEAVVVVEEALDVDEPDPPHPTPSRIVLMTPVSTNSDFVVALVR